MRQLRELLDPYPATRIMQGRLYPKAWGKPSTLGGVRIGDTIHPTSLIVDSYGTSFSESGIKFYIQSSLSSRNAGRRRVSVQAPAARKVPPAGFWLKYNPKDVNNCCHGTTTLKVYQWMHLPYFNIIPVVFKNHLALEWNENSRFQIDREFWVDFPVDTPVYDDWRNLYCGQTSFLTLHGATGLASTNHSYPKLAQSG